MRRVELVVVLDGRLRLFSSMAAAEARLDPAELRVATATAAFDRDGNPQRLRIDDNGWGQETLRIVAASDATPAPGELAARLAAFLAGHGSATRATTPLAELLRRSAPFCEA